MTSPTPKTRPESLYKSGSAGVDWEIAPLPSGTAVLNLSGDLKPGWLGRLSSNLSGNTINILKGTALKHSPLYWDASFEIETISGFAFEEFNPLPAVTGTTEQVAGTPLVLTDYQIEYSTRHGGSIYAEISGADCIGFLYGVLKIFSFYSLFPTELEISTKGKTALDRFWLKGIGASAPEKDDISALNRRLFTMLSGKA
ncbi:MAG: hypothetical protein PHY09_15960 [Desulfuromonadaceae bacterium]|nr:hypothetical protein [Desulfuromonadaceae bacterium]MDD5105647.1 hypothetical protein [Desulfuromonadaceae bacterium]